MARGKIRTQRTRVRRRPRGRWLGLKMLAAGWSGWRKAVDSSRVNRPVSNLVSKGSLANRDNRAINQASNRVGSSKAANNRALSRVASSKADSSRVDNKAGSKVASGRPDLTVHVAVREQLVHV